MWVISRQVISVGTSFPQILKHVGCSIPDCSVRHSASEFQVCSVWHLLLHKRIRLEQQTIWLPLLDWLFITNIHQLPLQRLCPLKMPRVNGSGLVWRHNSTWVYSSPECTVWGFPADLDLWYLDNKCAHLEYFVRLQLCAGNQTSYK